MSNALTIVIVEKSGSLKSTTIKDFKEDDLFKKCGFKKGDDFIKQNVWNVRTGGKKYVIAVYAKTDGRANSENKYDFPPPIDSSLFFGSCAIVAKDDTGTYTDLSVELWNKIYEKLFGGFEDLAATALDDENEEDELANVPKEKKTKDGYLKDGFVVDGSDEDDEEDDDIGSDTDEHVNDDNDEADEDDDDTEEYDDGDELTEDSYDYDSEEDNK
jgi:hypothetical protein